MRDPFDGLVDRVAKLQSEVRGTPHFEWGTITAASPLAVQLDGDPAPLLGTPSTLVSRLRVNDRVRVEIQNKRVVIHGRAAASSGDTGIQQVAVPGTSSGWLQWERLNGWINMQFDVEFTTAVAVNGTKAPMVTLPLEAAPLGNTPFAVMVWGSNAADGYVGTTGQVTFRNTHTAAASRFAGAGVWPSR